MNVPVPVVIRLAYVARWNLEMSIVSVSELESMSSTSLPVMSKMLIRCIPSAEMFTIDAVGLG